jgi:monothiol glutaredoxin
MNELKFSEIRDLITNNHIVLFMKGTKNFPQCGFSATVVKILNNLCAEYKDVNVLDDFDLRENIKLYSDWPTIPQLYIKQEFIGGCDIVVEMNETGELEALIKQKNNG